MARVKIKIDGAEVKADTSMTIMDAARENGIYIPGLCHHPDLVPSGLCRICIVGVKGREKPVVSCKTTVENGMEVFTDNPLIDADRRMLLELIHANHKQDCTNCLKNNNCQLQEVTAFVEVNEERIKRMRKEKPLVPDDDSNPFFTLSHEKCILCGICIRTCNEIQGVDALQFANRGTETLVSTFLDGNIKDSVCESCGECVVRCPVGALLPKGRQQPARKVKTICHYCGVGCGIYLGIRGSRVVGVEGDRSNPVNEGRLCVKGRFGYHWINHPDRLKTPLVRKEGRLVETGWDEALELVARKFSGFSGDEFATFSSAKCTNEENYLIQKFTRAVMGSNHIDHCARLCHAPSVAGLASSLGSGAMTNPIEQISDASCIMAVGTNTTESHPVIALRIKEARRKGASVIVVNPRRIDLCKHADLWLQHKPGSDVALIMAMCRIILENDLYDKSFIKERCIDFDIFRRSLEAFSLDVAERITGVPAGQIWEAAHRYAAGGPASILYAMGITQHSHGTDNVLAISNLALLTGNAGRDHAGINPLRGQNNVQGACDMGALPDTLPGYQKLSDPDVRMKFDKAWNCRLKEEPGLTLTEIIGAIAHKKIRALYLVGENSLLSEPDANHVRSALEKLDFFVAQDVFLSETAALADVVLPAASFAEKDGTFTNTERRVQRVRKAIQPAGNSRPDWWITSQIAVNMGQSGFQHRGPEQIMEEIAMLTPQYRGITYKRIEDSGLQWPVLDKKHKGTPVLHTENFATPDGKARFFPLTYIPPFELPDKEYPLMLTTGRSLYHYHTGTLTRRVDGLNSLNGREMVEMHPEDAKAAGLTDGDRIIIRSRRGLVKAALKTSDRCPKGVVSMSFHFAESPTNVLTSPVLDPVAKIPELKVCAVSIVKH